MSEELMQFVDLVESLKKGQFVEALECFSKLSEETRTEVVTAALEGVTPFIQLVAQVSAAVLTEFYKEGFTFSNWSPKS